MLLMAPPHQISSTCTTPPDLHLHALRASADLGSCCEMCPKTHCSCCSYPLQHNQAFDGLHLHQQGYCLQSVHALLVLLVVAEQASWELQLYQAHSAQPKTPGRSAVAMVLLLHCACSSACMARHLLRGKPQLSRRRDGADARGIHT